jgi:hypothetical protein
MRLHTMCILLELAWLWLWLRLRLILWLLFSTALFDGEYSVGFPRIHAGLILWSRIRVDINAGRVCPQQLPLLFGTL